jgi:tetratricopeptide (TPR) repeat protein
VYSLGVILYQLLTGGKFPYDVIGNMREVLDNILRAEPAKPSTIRHKINDEVETIVLKALQKERDRRYQTAGELARDVRRYLSGEPIEALRDSGWYVIRKTLRKYQVPTAVAALFLLVLIAFGVTSFVLYRDAEHSRSVTASALEEKGMALAVAETAKTRAENLNAAYERVTAAGRELRRRTLTDYYRRIENLVGATDAKEALLRDGLAYLEALRQEASTDPAFREELADALEAVGRIEAGMYTARVGKASDGEKHLAEAVDIGQKLVDERPMDPARQVRLSRSTLQLAQVVRQAQRFEEAIRMVESSLAHAERGVILLGDGNADAALVDEAKTARANANVALGELKIRQGQKAGTYAATEALTKEGEARYDFAGAYWKERAARDPKDPKAARLVIVMRDKKSQPAMFRAAAMAAEARMLAEAGKLEEARPKYDDALRMFEGAAELSSESVRAFRELNDQFKDDAEIMRSVCVSLRNVGDALTRRGELEAEVATRYNDPARRARARSLQEQAFTPLSESVSVARAAASTDAKNLDAQRAVYATLVKLGTQQRALGNLLAADGVNDAALAPRAKVLLGEAAKTFEAARVQAEYVAGLDPTNLHKSDLVNIDLRLAEASADQGLYAQAIGAYERAISLMDTLPDEGGFSKASREYSDAQKALDESRARLGAPGDK